MAADKQQEEKKGSNYPKDTVIHHQIGRGPFAPSLSPFPVKLETYLRMAKIPNQNDMSGQMSSKGKTPWITYNGEDVADSQICINFLNKKLGINLNKHLTELEKAKGMVFQIMLEEHLYWTLVFQRWVNNEAKYPKRFLPHDLWKEWKKNITEQLQGQGIGRHSNEYVSQLAVDDLVALSTFLGNKPFVMGDEPCEFDCAIFGILTMPYWQMPGSIQEKTIKENKNLEDYCLRMKEKFWPDWDQCNTAGGTKKATA